MKLPSVSQLLNLRSVVIYLTLGLLVTVSLWAPHRPGVILSKICMVTLASLIGYWISRAVFNFQRVGSLYHMAESMECDRTAGILNTLLIARAIVVASAIIGVSVGM